MENLYGWAFNYNPHTQNWRAIKREHYTEMFSKTEDENGPMLVSRDIQTLIDLIVRTNGEKESIDKLIK